MITATNKATDTTNDPTPEELARLIEDASDRRGGSGLTTEEVQQLWDHLHELRIDAAIYQLWERGELLLFLAEDGDLGYAARTGGKAHDHE
jgi:hypothetical protein